MAYIILVSRTFQKSFHELPKDLQERMKKHLQLLKEDPITPRSHCDIKVLRDTDPKKYRMRIGEYRIIYSLDTKTVKVIELMKREKG